MRIIYAIFIGCLLLPTYAMAKSTPIETAILQSNEKTVETLLKQDAALANSKPTDSSNRYQGVLEMTIRLCCGKNNGHNTRDKIAKLLIDSGADINVQVELFSHLLGNKPRGSLLDLVDSLIESEATCQPPRKGTDPTDPKNKKNNTTPETCNKIRNILVSKGVKSTYNSAPQNNNNTPTITQSTDNKGATTGTTSTPEPKPELKTITATISGVKLTYNDKAQSCRGGISNVDPSDAKITFSKSENGTYGNDITATDIGNIPVYYKIEKEGYATKTGKYNCEIEKRNVGTRPTNNNTPTKATSDKITITGTIIEKNKPEEPVSFANIGTINLDKPIQTSTTVDGKFTLRNVPKDAQIKITSSGYEEKIIDNLTPTMTIEMTPSSKTLDEVKITANRKQGDCSEEIENSLKAEWQKDNNGEWICVLIECDSGYDKIDGKTCSPKKYLITYDLEGGTGINQNDTYTYYNPKALPIPKRSGFKFDGWYDNENFDGTPVISIALGDMDNKTFYAKWTQIECTPDEEKKLKDAGAATVKFENDKCVIASCTNATAYINDNKCNECAPCDYPDFVDCNITITNDQTCEYNTSCKTGFENPTGAGKTLHCTKIPKSIIITFDLDDATDGNGCDTMTVKMGDSVDVNCQPNKPGYAAIWTLNGESTPMPYHIDSIGDTDLQFKVINWDPIACQGKTPDDYSNAREIGVVNGVCGITKCIDGYILQNGNCVENAAQKEYDDAKARETSLENRMLSGTTMLATGIGGMNTGIGIARNMADNDADKAMAAYLDTFKCYVGNDEYAGGEKNISVPGLNQLNQLKQEYTRVANLVKKRKEELGMAPGIESEVVLDKSNMGLYDDKSTGSNYSGIASRYRAALGSQQDADALAKQSEDSKNQLTAGAATTGAGIVGGVAGNLMINYSDDEDSIGAKMKSALQSVIGK